MRLTCLHQMMGQVDEQHRQGQIALLPCISSNLPSATLKASGLLVRIKRMLHPYKN